MKYDATTLAIVLLFLTLFQSSHVLATDVTDTSDPLWDSQYTASQNRSLRIVSICFSSLSLLAGTYGIFWFFYHQYKKRHLMKNVGFRSRVIKFRRKLVLALILFDFLKALMLTIYPAKKLRGTPDSPQFAAVIGWFTNVAIEGGDMSAFLLAVQTAMMVFAPQNEHSKDNLWNRRFAKYFQNGLYPYRKYIYVFCFTVFPTLLSSLAFVGTNYPAAQNLGFRGYVPLPTFVFLPASPTWYRAVLSWGPRYFIMFAIFAIYIAVFIHVRREFKRLDVSMAELAAGAEGGGELEEKLESRKGTWTRVRIWLSHFPGLGVLYHHHHHYPGVEEYENEDWIGDGRQGSSSDLEAQGGPLTALSTPPGTPMRTADSPTEDEGPVTVTPGRRAANLSDLQTHINRQNLKRFRQRRADIERQMNYIFIYPLAYLLLWTGPFVQQAMQYSKHKNEYSKFSIMIWAVVSQASNCFIDTVVFILRESNYRQWRRERKLRKQAEERTQECTDCNEPSDKSHEDDDDTQSRNDEENDSSAGTIISPPTFGNYEMRFGASGGGGGTGGNSEAGGDGQEMSEGSDSRDSDPLSAPPTAPTSGRRTSLVTCPPPTAIKSSDRDTVPEMMFVRSPGGVTFGVPFGRRSGELDRDQIHSNNHSPSPSQGHSHRDLSRGSISWGFGGRRKSEFSSGDEEMDLVDFLRQ
ncbi:G protein-coupled receptor GPR1 [Yarrowia sp. C11]|nr:G protein-coupled receptor GPR1 [Yarrowia sp. C11]KAG5364134.1 G protein-coupled receptor GPR1 [Yarrowia sp. E02]